jgi:hypothetical protein
VGDSEQHSAQSMWPARPIFKTYHSDSAVSPPTRPSPSQSRSDPVIKKWARFDLRKPVTALTRQPQSQSEVTPLATPLTVTSSHHNLGAFHTGASGKTIGLNPRHEGSDDGSVLL